MCFQMKRRHSQIGWHLACSTWPAAPGLHLAWGHLAWMAKSLSTRQAPAPTGTWADDGFPD